MGCGPYILAEWQNGNQIVLKKKINWWGDALIDQRPSLAAHPEEIRYKIIPDNASAIAALKDGQLDVMSEINPLSFNELKQTDYITDRFSIVHPIQFVLLLHCH